MLNRPKHIKSHDEFLYGENYMNLTNFALVQGVVLAALILVVGCGPSAEEEALTKAHVAAAERCAAQWRDKRWVPLRGSGWWLDSTRLSWRMDGGLWTTDDNCGAAQIYEIFYWDGEKIRPERVGMSPHGRWPELHPKEIQRHWVFIVGGSADTDVAFGSKGDDQLFFGLSTINGFLIFDCSTGKCPLVRGDFRLGSLIGSTEALDTTKVWRNAA